MRSTPSLLRRVLLIALICPALLGSEFKCVAVSNPSVATARIDSLEPATPRVGDVVQVTGSGNGTPPLQFAWDFGDGTQTFGMQAAHAYLAPGSYRVTLTVRDATGHRARDSSQVDVSARVLPSLTTLVLVSDAVAGEPVVFEILVPEENPDALTVVWAFSDGQLATGPLAAATFPVAGIYLASVAVTSDLGATSVAEITFQVVDAAR